MSLPCRILLIAACALAALSGCAPNAGTVNPSFPWERQTPAPTRAEQRRQMAAIRQEYEKQQQQSQQLALQQRQQAIRELSGNHASDKQELAGRLGQLRQQSIDLDSNNRDLHAQLARASQRTDVMQDEIDLLKRRLDDTTRQLAQAQVQRQEVDQQMKALQASTRRRAGATITANSSLSRGITAVMVPGMDIRQDGDVVRISVPSDKLFMAGTATLHQGSQSYMDQVSRVVLEHYPRQIIGIEAHTDQGTSLAGTQWRNAHQLTAAQAMAVFEQLAARNLNAQQLYVLGHGANQPLVSDGTPQGQAVNRRVEVVVYPETFPGP